MIFTNFQNWLFGVEPSQPYPEPFPHNDQTLYQNQAPDANIDRLATNNFIY